MKVAELRSRFFGPRWRFPVYSLAAGIGYAGLLVLIGFMDTYPGAVPVVAVLVPLAIVLAQYDGGIVSVWMGTFMFAFFERWRGPCWGGIDCVSAPDPVQVLPEAVVTAVVAGLLGYGISEIVNSVHDDSPVWRPVGYYVVSLVLLFGLVAAFDTFVFF